MKISPSRPTVQGSRIRRTCQSLFLLALVALASPALAARISPPELLQDMAERFATVRDYDVLVQTETPGRRPRNERYRLQFLRRQNERQTNMFRLKVRSGPHDGDELLVRQDGVIRFQADGLFKPVATLRRDHPRARLAEGLPLWEADFGSIISRLTAVCRRASGRTIEDLTPQELQKLDLPDPQGGYRIRMEYPDDRNRRVQEEVVVGRSTMMPLLIGRVRDGKLVDRLTFRGFKANDGKDIRDFRF